MVRQLQERTGKQGLCYEVNEWLPQAFIQNAGGDVIDGDGRPVMDSAAAVKGIEAFVQPRRDNLWRVDDHPRDGGGLSGRRDRRHGLVLGAPVGGAPGRHVRPAPAPDAGPRRPCRAA